MAPPIRVLRQVTGRRKRGLKGTGGFAGLLILLALLIDLSGVKWGSYLPTGVPGLYLADALLGIAAVLAAMNARQANSQRISNRTVMLVLVPISGYLSWRLIEQFDQPRPWQLWIRDVAPFVYLLTVPFLALALANVHGSVLVRVVRIASMAVAAVAAGRLLGLLDPIPIGTAIPLFSPRPDVENVVLGLGVVAFGRWGDSLHSHRIAQISLVAIAAVNYSRAGLLAAILCVIVASLRERNSLRASPAAVGSLCVMLGLAGLTLTDPAIITTDALLRNAEALRRLFASDTQAGTTEARLRAWELLVNWLDANNLVVQGAGPGTDPILRSGAIAYLSGDESVRAPHSWPVGALVYHGAIGLVVWFSALACVISQRISNWTILPMTAIAAYLLASLFGVVIESPFGSLPVAVFCAFVLAHSQSSAATQSFVDSSAHSTATVLS